MSVDRSKIVRFGAVGAARGAGGTDPVVAGDASLTDDAGLETGEGALALLDGSRPDIRGGRLPVERDERVPAWPKQPSWPLVDESELAQFPQQGGSGWIGPVFSFLVMVAAPLGALLYYFITIATPQYFAEFRFSVTEVQQNAPSSSGSNGSAAAALATTLGAGNAGGALGGSMQNYVVVDYLKSRQAVDELDAKVNLRKLYGASYIDWWSRLRANASPEQLVGYWNGMFAANYDPLTGIANAQIKAFTANDAFQIAQSLVKQAETLVNTIAQRSQLDQIRFAQDQVERAQAHLKDVRQQLASYREQQGVIDPTQSVVPSNSQLASNLRDALAQSLTQLGASKNQKIDDQSPQSVVLRNKIAATIEQLNKVEQEVGGNRQGKSVLAGVVARYEALSLDRQYAETLLLTDLQALDVARANAAAQHLYLTPHVQPALPGSPSGPDVTKSMSVAALALVAFWFLTLLGFRSVKQHGA